MTSGHNTLSSDNAPTSSGGPLWSPSAPEKTLLADFMRQLGHENITDYDGFWQWSVDNPEKFWDKVWDFAEIVGEKGDVVLENGENIQKARFFPRASVNYAENMLKTHNDAPAIIALDEKGRERTYSHSQLYAEVAKWQTQLKAWGVRKGDRVAAFMPNLPETIIAFLATASIGAVWSSASPDFGVQGLIDRFGQIEPKVFITVDGYFYNGKTLDCLQKAAEVVPHLKGLERTVVVPFVSDAPDLSLLPDAVTSDSFGAGTALTFERVPFNHPLAILFSSGTTGIPKCIVHGHGGTLIQHLKEHQLQTNIKSGDRIFYFTTCGWMMWNWLVSGIGSGATLMLYDGSPFYPDGNVLWSFAAKHKAKLFGTSAKYIDALKANNLNPGRDHDLSSLEVITSTGSPLVHESFDYVYDAIKKDVHLASISGGTDIVSCFVLGNPVSPVWRGEIQGAGLGMAVNAFDDDGKPIAAGAGSGELVCTKPFPCMPVMFWNDEDGAKYRAAYFERFDNVWCHGDWIERTPHGGFIIHGRSDATLNPGGVRIGTAEIYRQVEQVQEVLESIAVGQDWEGDVRIILFVRMKEGHQLDDVIREKIKKQIRSGASPRHVPAKIIQVVDIPRTKSGKMTELAVRDVIHGRKVKNVEALANPEALDLYKNLQDLQN
ncbi:MAG: acetoacetate--CoA ligase [Micavibrio aeruginosavorus]|uniref:Acetoacetate--CoA ligase n=1 Tax=Micavibrio aeruginosavorus TaxID=349221 RepID=A0A2W5BWW3_9BACT|nr:MAG: acetoacetate--CoA ligase [Micavibrio aeruginosavorus]